MAMSDESLASPHHPTRMRVSAAILCIIVCTQTCISAFLIWVLMSGRDFQFFQRVFGGDWYSNLLQSSLIMTLLLVVIGVPYAVVGLARRSGHRGAMLGILFGTGVSAVCVFGVFGFIAMLSYG